MGNHRKLGPRGRLYLSRWEMVGRLSLSGPGLGSPDSQLGQAVLGRVCPAEPSKGQLEVSGAFRATLRLDHHGPLSLGKEGSPHNPRPREEALSSQAWAGPHRQGVQDEKGGLRAQTLLVQSSQQWETRT